MTLQWDTRTLSGGSSLFAPQLPELGEENVLDRIVQAHAIPLNRKVKVEDDLLEKIRAHVGGPVDPADVYAFQMVAASDGLDSYYTQHDIETSLKPMAGDLAAGQSVLGSHDYETFSYGSSVDGRVQRADTKSPVYEETFSRHTAGDEKWATKHWLVGDYYVVRGLELNGQKTDSIIRAMELGAVRKASISFMVDEYRCGLDGKDMLGARLFSSPGARAARHEVDEETECLHLPGVTYPEGMAWASMHGSQLIETSLVYKNSSPSSLLLRKAEALAAAGILSAGQVAAVENRFGVRLPSFERKVWAPGKEDDVPKRSTDETTTPAVEPVEDALPDDAETAAPAAEADPVEGEEHEEEDEAEEPETTAESVIAEFVAAGSAIRSAITAQLLSTEQLDQAARAGTDLDTALVAAGVRTVSTTSAEQQDAAWKARTHEAEEAMGGPLTASAIRALKGDADLGRQLFESLVNDAVAARNGLGVEYSQDEYRKLLLGSRSVEFVKAEKASYEALKAERFKSGRQVVPPEVRADKPAKKAPAAPAEDADEDNIFATKKEV